MNPSRRLSQGSSMKEDIGQVYVLGDETFAQVIKMSRDIRNAVEQLTKLIAETRGLKANDASVISELTLLRDQADTFSQDLVGLAASVEGQTASIHDISAQEMSILAPDEADARRYFSLGATVVAVGSDLGVFRSGTQALRDKYRA